PHCTSLTLALQSSDRNWTRSATNLSPSKPCAWWSKLLDSLPDDGPDDFAAIARALGGCRLDHQRVAVQREEPYLIRPGPRVVPRDVDVVDDLVALHRICARIGDHRVVQLGTFGIARHRLTWFDAFSGHGDHRHVAVSRVVEVSARMRSQRIAALPRF